jgi:hypothetical protein
VILRIAAALSLLLGGAGLVGFLFLIGKGPMAPAAARHLRAMKNRITAPDSLADVAFADFTALPHQAPLAEVAALERRGVRLEGYVQRMQISSDGDIHLEIATGPDAPDWPRAVYVTGEITQRWWRGSRTWTYDQLVATLRPMIGGATPWDGGARRVRISGWLLYDYQYDLPHDTPRAPWQMRETGWEIHPVTGIERWDDSLAAFAEYRR